MELLSLNTVKIHDKNPLKPSFSLITQIVMFASMILNDLLDINVDKINNPSRPLVKQIISVYEAIISSSLLYIFAFLLNNYKLTGLSRIIGNNCVILSILYTPIIGNNWCI